MTTATCGAQSAPSTKAQKAAATEWLLEHRNEIKLGVICRDGRVSLVVTDDARSAALLTS